MQLQNIVPAVPYLTFGWHDIVFAVAGLSYVDRNELWEVTATLSSQFFLVRIPFSQTWN